MQLEKQMKQIARRMDVARKKEKADLTVRNARVVNVFLREVQLQDVAVSDGVIAGVYPAGEGPAAEKEIDAGGLYMIPGLIDAHTHVEMAYVSAASFAEGVLPWGTTTALLDPHDTSNVMGNEGVELLAKEFQTTPLKAIFMTPPCVPSAPIFEDAGFEVTLDSLVESRKIPLIKGIAETMDFNRVLAKEPELLSILAYGRENELLFDGHAPCVVGTDAMAYFGSGPIRTDHESVTVDEMYEKYSMGVHVIIRRGSLAEPASAGELVSRLSDTSRLLLATDGCINVKDMVHKGHMNYALKQIVAEGVDPMTAVQMGTINVARAHRIDHRVGAIAPGLEADMVLVEDLKDFNTKMVFVNGREIPKDFRLPRTAYPEKVVNSIKLPPLTPADLQLKAENGRDSASVRVLTVIDQTVATELETAELSVKDGCLYSDTDQDVLKGITLERYGRGKGSCIGFIRGFNLKRGAIAGSIGQDTQNMTAVGVCDSDICAAVNAVTEMQGGVALAVDGKVVASIPMPIFGIMSEKPFTELESEFAKLQSEYEKLGGTLSDAVFTLSLLLTLVVIPDGGLSNRGLVDVMAGKFVDVIQK